jgi:hypothetical protein
MHLRPELSHIALLRARAKESEYGGSCLSSADGATPSASPLPAGRTTPGSKEILYGSGAPSDLTPEYGHSLPGGSGPTYPAAFPSVVAVGATSRNDRRWPGSSTGSHIWISAPGEDILTTCNPDTYVEQDGTSFATPMVSAAVWLMRRARPEWGVDKVRNMLK